MAQYLTDPCCYFDHLFGSCGPGSLHYELKSKGCVNSIKGLEQRSFGFSFYEVHMELTEIGIRYTDEIITCVFQYINMLRLGGVEKWLWDECANIARISFAYMEMKPPDTWTKALSNMLRNAFNNLYISPKKIISNEFIWKEFQPNLINNILQQMIPRKTRVTVVGKEFQWTTNRVEKWYGAAYSVYKIPESTLQRWECAGLNKKFHLPAENEYIPSSFPCYTLFQTLSSYPVPLNYNGLTRLWYKPSNAPLPYSSITLSISSHSKNLDPCSIDINLQMYVRLLEDEISDQLYNAKLAGLKSSIWYEKEFKSIMLNISGPGYSDKQLILLKKVMNKMVKLDFKPERLNIVKKSLIAATKNFKTLQPYLQAKCYVDILFSGRVLNSIDGLNTVSIDSVEESFIQFLSTIHIVMLVSGNATEQQARELKDIVESSMPSWIQPPRKGEKELSDFVENNMPLLWIQTPGNSEKAPFQQLKLPAGCEYLYQHNHELHSMSAVLVYYECSIVGTHENMLLYLFCRIIKEPCFDFLRTKLQLGYIVLCEVIENTSGTSGLSIIVQSDFPPQYVERKVDKFLHRIGKFIENMSDQQFQDHINALATLQLASNSEENHHKFNWKKITSNWYLSGRKQIESERVQSLSKYQVYEFYRQYIAVKGLQRRKLTIYILGRNQ